MDIPTNHSASPPISPPPHAGTYSGSGSPPSLTGSPQERPMSISPPDGAVRHVQSNTALHPNVSRHPHRHSAHLGTKNTKSPVASIPSSPTSVHSSSSAIFERDIEPISSPPLLASPTSHCHNTTAAHQHVPHARAHALDASVPAVLDSAAEILATLSPEEVAAHGDLTDTISVVAPTAMSIPPSRSGLSSPSGGAPRSLHSRSPSPIHLQGAIRAISSGSLMLNLSSQNSGSPPPSPPGGGNATARPTINTAMMISPDTPSIVTPTSVDYSTAGSSPTVEGDPQTATIPSSPPRSPKVSLPMLPSSTAPSTNKRLSFLSYNDILTSTPSSTIPLSSLTTSARSDLPPGHIPEVDAGIYAATGGNTSTSATSSPRLGSSLIIGTPQDEGSLLMWRKDVSTENNPIGPGGTGPMDEGGEWEREGMGMGMEERLEAIEMMSSSGVLPPVTGS